MKDVCKSEEGLKERERKMVGSGDGASRLQTPIK
jgi:hypothetical protein